MPAPDDDLNLAQMVQELGKEYAESLDAVHASLREIWMGASLDDAALFVANLGSRGWLLEHNAETRSPDAR